MAGRTTVASACIANCVVGGRLGATPGLPAPFQKLQEVSGKLRAPSTRLSSRRSEGRRRRLAGGWGGAGGREKLRTVCACHSFSLKQVCTALLCTFALTASSTAARLACRASRHAAPLPCCDPLRRPAPAHSSACGLNHELLHASSSSPGRVISFSGGPTESAHHAVSGRTCAAARHADVCT